MELPRNWNTWVNRAQTAAEVDAVRQSIKQGRPYGEPAWQEQPAKKLGLESTLRPRGRPRIAE